MALGKAKLGVGFHSIMFLAILFCVLGPFSGYAWAQHGTFNHPGNILITDQFNNRVIAIDQAGNIVWQFGGGPDGERDHRH